MKSKADLKLLLLWERGSEQTLIVRLQCAMSVKGRAPTYIFFLRETQLSLYQLKYQYILLK